MNVLYHKIDTSDVIYLHIFTNALAASLKKRFC